MRYALFTYQIREDEKFENTQSVKEGAFSTPLVGMQKYGLP